MSRHHERDLSTVVRWIGGELDRGRSVDQVVRDLEEQGVSPKGARYLVERVAVQPVPPPATLEPGLVPEGLFFRSPASTGDAVDESIDGPYSDVFQPGPGIVWH
jgi:hypothetical protein